MRRTWETRKFEIGIDIIDGSTAIPLEFSGAGRWEALVLSTALADGGTVTILDEPAINLHPTLQRRLLQTIRKGSSQTLLVTHSPSLVPAGQQAEIEQIVRLTRENRQTTIHRAMFDQEPAREADATASKLQQLMLSSSDVRALLFANVALLVEGDAELGVLGIWLPQVASAQGIPSPGDLNLVIASVGGDGYLGRYVSYLDMFGVPWAIFCDGKALRPRDRKALFGQLADKLTGDVPAEDTEFSAWRDYWATQGVFTLAGSFEKEIETALEHSDPQAWEAAMSSYPKSKVRAGRAFAENAAPPDGLHEIHRLILEHLDLVAGSRS